MKKLPEARIDFAPNVKWISSHSTSYIHRNLSEVGRRMIHSYLLTTDEGFHHILRQCRDRWVVALTVGQRSCSIVIYDYSKFVDKLSHRGSSPIRPGISGVAIVDRSLNIEYLSETDAVDATSTGGLVYASRSLTDFEIGVADAIGRETIDLIYGKRSDGKTLTFDDRDIDNIVMRIMSIKGRRWTSKLDSEVQEIIQSSRLSRF